MRLPDEVLKSVVFLGQRQMDRVTNAEKDVLGGTAFFVAIPAGRDQRLICLVTAKHVAREIEHGKFFVRANTRNGPAADYPIDAGVEAEWLFHEDESVDAAVMIWCPPSEVDFMCIPENMFLNRERVPSTRIGIGDQTYVTGLFHFHAGKDRNEPIVRTGHIATMAQERIPVRNWHKGSLEGYLIDSRSIGGMSGSPVFVQRSIEVQHIEPSGRKPLAAGAIFWLGLMHGHWDLPESESDGFSQRGPDPETKINAGVSIVVPCQKILEIFSHKKIIEACAKAAEAKDIGHVMDRSGKTVILSVAASAGSYTFRPATARGIIVEPMATKKDSAFSSENEVQKASSEPETENPSHKEDFTSLLGAAARSNKPTF